MEVFDRFGIVLGIRLIKQLNRTAKRCRNFDFIMFNSSCITLLQDKMSKHLRDTDDVDVDDNGSTTPKKKTSRNLASPIKVQFTPKFKTR